MTEDTKIVHETAARHGRYVVRMPDGAEAEMTYVIVSEDVRDFNHTYVPDIFRGSGVAAKLMARAVADARTQGFRITPSCSYVAAQFRRHPEWADLLA